MPPDGPRPFSLMRSLGQFVGHILHAVKTDPAAARRVVRHETEEQTRDSPAGRAVLRRTTIEEIEFRPPEAPS